MKTLEGSKICDIFGKLCGTLLEWRPVTLVAFDNVLDNVLGCHQISESINLKICQTFVLSSSRVTNNILKSFTFICFWVCSQICFNHLADDHHFCYITK